MRAQNKMAYNREEVQWAWLLVVLSKDFFGQGHCASQKETDLYETKINTYADFELCLFTEEEKKKKRRRRKKKKMMEKLGF